MFGNIEKRDEKWECFFAKVILVFGIIMILVVPIMEVQDEDTHTMRSINMSYLNYNYRDGFNIFQSVYTFIETYTEGNGVYVFEENPDYRINNDIYRNAIRIPLNPNEKVLFCDGKPLRTALYGNLAYLPQGIGIFVGRILKLPIFYTLILGRFFKLLFYTILCYWAIRLIPVKKKLMTLLCLMPMPVFFAASLSPDGVLVSACYLFISYCLYSKAKHNCLTSKGIILLYFLFALIFSVKMIYSCIILFLLIFVDFKKMYFKNKKRVIITVVLGMIGFMILFWGAYILSPMVRLCVDNILVLIYLYFKTYITNFSYYLSLGIANFGTGYCPLRKEYVYLASAYIVLVALQSEDTEISAALIGQKVKVISGVLFLLISVLIFMGGILMSSLEVINYKSNVVGIQGRYFFAFVPFIMLVISNDKIRFKWVTGAFAVKLASIIMLVISIVWISWRYW